MTQTNSTGAAWLASSTESIEWAQIGERLRNSVPGNTIDDLIDTMTEAVFAGKGSVGTAECLTAALMLARSDLSLRSAALALAISAPDGDTVAVDTLVATFGRVANYPFLAPALLEALGLLAMRNPHARAQLCVLLLRLHTGDSRYLLVKAAQVIGRLDAVRPEPDLRAKLDEFVTVTDLAVQAEARFQLALVSLAFALMAEDQPALSDRLIAARAAFARADRSEEHRPDAAMFVRLLDALLAFMALARDSGATAGVVEPTGRLEQSLSSLATHDWHGYRSDRETLRALRVLNIASALRRAAEATGTVEEWPNFAAALEDLARLHALIRGETILNDDNKLSSGAGVIADKIFAASLGPLLARVVHQRRFARITQDYVATHGDDVIAQGLRALEQAAAAFAFAADPVLNEGLAAQVADLATQVGRRPDTLLQETIEALVQHRLPQWLEDIGLTSAPLPIERPDLFGNDPAVDEVVRPLVRRVADLLGEYSPAKWARLVEVLVSIVKFAHYVRDRAPIYVRCEADGGLGQGANEGQLQEHLFEWLRQGFGPKAIYEFARSGGGRPDTGVVFDTARFPVEAKHEFESISPEHVRTSFVAQSDVYATAADRVSFLMVLDLRAGNAAGHRNQKRTTRTNGGQTPVAGLYHLRDSFWVESMPPDPDLPNATSKAVIVGLVPGNRPLPSSMSTYSRRPVSARQHR